MNKTDIRRLYWSLLIAQLGAGMACFVAKANIACLFWSINTVLTVRNLIDYYRN